MATKIYAKIEFKHDLWNATNILRNKLSVAACNVLVFG